MRRLLPLILILGGFFSLIAGCFPTRDDVLALAKEAGTAAAMGVKDAGVAVMQKHADAVLASLDGKAAELKAKADAASDPMAKLLYAQAASLLVFAGHAARSWLADRAAAAKPESPTAAVPKT